jgi:predicted nucleic acid-binding protein
MAGYFLETSALVKRYVAERGSGWVTALTNPGTGNACWLAATSRVEVLSAFYLKVRTGHLTQAQARRADQVFRQELATHYQLIPVRNKVLNRAMRLVARYPLRAYDAMQLAAALYLLGHHTTLGLPAPTFVCADQSLNLAAVAEGLQVDDPNQHP